MSLPLLTGPFGFLQKFREKTSLTRGALHAYLLARAYPAVVSGLVLNLLFATVLWIRISTRKDQ